MVKSCLPPAWGPLIQQIFDEYVEMAISYFTAPCLNLLEHWERSIGRVGCLPSHIRKSVPSTAEKKVSVSARQPLHAHRHINQQLGGNYNISRRSPDNIFSSSTVEGDKAEAIRFLGGRYAGKTGCLRHSRRKRGQLYYYVLVDLGDSTMLKTYVQIDNIEQAEMPMTTSYAEALLQQHINIEVAMNKLANQLPTCSIQEGTHNSSSAKSLQKSYTLQ
jgi:hypothetical protein